MLRTVTVRLLKQTDGETHAVGQMLERALDYLDLGDMALSGYIGEVCPLCDKKFETLTDLEEAVWIGKPGHPQIGHKSCYDKFWMTDTDVAKEIMK